MPLTANTANVAILHESTSAVRVSMWMHQNLTGDEADVLKVNVATLTSRTLQLNTATAAPPQSFAQGEQVTGGTSAAIGFVRDWNAATKVLTIILSSGVFSGTEVVTGAQIGTSITLTSITTPTY